MRKLLILSLMVILFSCTTQRKADKFYRKNPILLAQKCAETFPVIPKYIKGKDSIIYDTTTVTGDSIPCPPQTGAKVVKVKCPDQKTITNTIFRVDTLIKLDSARLKLCELRLAEASINYHKEKEKLSQARDKIKTLTMWCVILGAGLALGGVLKLRGII